MRPDPIPPTSCSSASRIAAWLDLMRTADKLLRAGLRREVGPEGDVDEAYRQWYADHMRQHDEVIERIVTRLRASRQESADAG